MVSTPRIENAATLPRCRLSSGATSSGALLGSTGFVRAGAWSVGLTSEEISTVSMGGKLSEAVAAFVCGRGIEGAAVGGGTAGGSPFVVEACPGAVSCAPRVSALRAAISRCTSCWRILLTLGSIVVRARGGVLAGTNQVSWQPEHCTFRPSAGITSFGISYSASHFGQSKRTGASILFRVQDVDDIDTVTLQVVC